MMSDKSKRKREWKSNEKNSAPPAADAIVDAAGKIDKDKFELLVKWVYQWTRDMHAWGQDARDDIVRLEGAAGFAAGDPGDPPDGPPGDE
jgi:hypothetical protein